MRDYVQSNSSQISLQLGVDPHFENRRVLLVDNDHRDLETLNALLAAPPQDASAGAAAGRAGSAAGPLHFEVATALQGVDAIALARESEYAERPFAIALIEMELSSGVGGWRPRARFGRSRHRSIS